MSWLPWQRASFTQIIAISKEAFYEKTVQPIVMIFSAYIADTIVNANKEFKDNRSNRKKNMA